MNTMNALGNGKIRKTLSSQIDRLDTMLDGLADAIPEVVADTIRAVAAQAVRDAVQTAITEALANPEVLAKLRATANPAPAQRAAKTSVRQRFAHLCQRVRGYLAQLRAACGTQMYRLRTALGNGWQRTLERLAALWQQCQIVRRYKYQILSALGIGLGAAALAWLGGRELATATSGLGGFGSTLGVHAGLWLRKTFGFGQQHTA